MDRRVIDLVWKIARGVLYTADRLAPFGYSLQLSCFCNSAPETIDHLFFECPLDQSVLSWLQSLMFRWSLVAPSLVLRYVHFGFNVDEFTNIPRVFIYIFNVCKLFSLLAWKNFHFHNIHPSTIDALANVRACVRFHLPIFFKRFHSARCCHFFISQWGACNVVASLVNDHLFVPSSLTPVQLTITHTPMHTPPPKILKIIIFFSNTVHSMVEWWKVVNLEK